MMSQQFGFRMLEEELKEFSLEKDVRTTVKTKEELDKVTVDETLNDIDRAVYLLSSGQEIQCISVIRNLPFLLKTWQSDCVQKVIPKLKDFLRNAGLDVQLVASEIFTLVINEQIFPAVAFAKYFLPTITRNINLKDPVSSKAWFSCLITSINYLPKETVQKEILEMAKQRGKLTQSPAIRQSCCTLLGAIAPKLDVNGTKADIVPIMKQLCQDIDFAVRASMSTHLLAIATALGAVESKNLVLNEALELAIDEECSVQGAALDSLIKMGEFLDENTIKESVIPVVCKFCELALSGQESQLTFVAKNLGNFCHRLSKYFNPEQRTQLIEVYRQLCKTGRTQVDIIKGNCTEVVCTLANVESSTSANVWDALENNTHLIACRRHCAFNFPAITLFCGTSNFESNLVNALSLLCTDPDDTVRKHVAAGFHEVASTLEKRSTAIYPHIVFFLRESRSPLVLDTFFKKLPETLNAVIVGGCLVEKKTHGLSDLYNSILAAISQLELVWSSAWRPLATIASHLATMPEYFSQDIIYSKLLPVAFKLLTHNPYLPVRRNAACSICMLIYRNRRNYQRMEMCNRLVQELCYARSFRHRVMFLRICTDMLKFFSKSFFKDNFFSHVLKLCDDRVSNVRLRVCEILPSLKGLLQLPKDRFLHLHLEAQVRKMTSCETDRDVVLALNAAIFRMDQIKPHVDSLSLPNTIDDDRAKENDERAVVEMEEKGVDEFGRLDVSLKGRRALALHSAPNIRVPKAPGQELLSKSFQQTNVSVPHDSEDLTNKRINVKSPGDVRLSPNIPTKGRPASSEAHTSPYKQKVSSFLPSTDSRRPMRKLSPLERTDQGSTSTATSPSTTPKSPAAKSPDPTKKKAVPGTSHKK